MSALQKIVTKLQNYYHLRDEYKAARQELFSIAVSLGQLQKDAINGSGAADFLGGYLVANGFMTKKQRESEANALHIKIDGFGPKPTEAP